MQHAPSPRQRGFSILEVLITLVVLAGGLLAIGGLYGKIMNGSAAAKERSEAVVLAEKKLEELRYALYSSIASGSDSVNAATGSGSSANFSRSWSVASSTSPAYKTVTVTVSWTDSRNQSQSAVLTSRISGIDPKRSGELIATVGSNSSGTGNGTGSGSGTGSNTGSDSGPGTGSDGDTGSGTDTGTDTPPVVCTTTLTISTQSANGTVGTDTSGASCSGAKKSWTCTATLAYGTPIIITYTQNKSSSSWGTTATCTAQTYSSF
ncbi:prepilin-type N-terminal cleavage/methylation domain-containing protein [Pseudogulbenkiania subflava]|uniref:Prepilin-type N-terminal cleavage/methylation domain-containing protein n=1 Tax=Pseudogulbenkiania subflava DSM 22618 TaxID=1123014 RepID=A0A1Y6B672_9NEIS|nr:prepilin-type N-terminal cleavage/methylation domain-containing protein [Pseudogulbenkiania subflava]SME94233.1 prepilin-type N-terminal cleavage/methylation domain-containing protein [Pseudogulbenkiania subflava DSM 22618]